MSFDEVRSAGGGGGADEPRKPERAPARGSAGGHDYAKMTQNELAQKFSATLDTLSELNQNHRDLKKSNPDAAKGVLQHIRHLEGEIATIKPLIRAMPENLSVKYSTIWMSRNVKD